MNVAKGISADRARLREGDVIISLAEQAITTTDDIHKLLKADTIGRRLVVIFLRSWTPKLEAHVEPGRSPD